MIIYDGEADGQTKEETYEGLTLRHPEAAHTQTNTLLPDYATSEAQHWKVVQPEEKKPRLLDSRLLKGALYALALYVFLSVVIVTPIVVTVCSFISYFLRAFPDWCIEIQEGILWARLHRPDTFTLVHRKQGLLNATRTITGRSNGFGLE